MWNNADIEGQTEGDQNECLVCWKNWLLMREEQWVYFSKAFSTASCSIPVVKFRKYELQNYKMGKKKKRLKYQA